MKAIFIITIVLLSLSITAQEDSTAVRVIGTTEAVFYLPVGESATCDLSPVLEQLNRIEAKTDSLITLLNLLWDFERSDESWNFGMEFKYAPGKPVPNFMPDSINVVMNRKPLEE